MTLFVHIGPTKTASTLGQIMFASANDTGACLYLPVGRAIRGGVGRVHHPVALAIQAPETPEAQALLAGIESCLASAQATSQSVLISSEMFPTEPEAYRPLRDMASRHGHDLRMVFVCRDPVARINSMYTQDIKTGSIHDASIAAYVATTLAVDSLRPCTVLRPGFAALGAGFDLLPYHADGMEPLYRQFCARIDLAVTAGGPDMGERVNAGPSAAAIRLVREGAVSPDTPNLYGVLQTADRKLAQPAYFGMTPELVAQVRSALTGELAAVRTAQMILGRYEDEVAADASHPPLNDGTDVADYDGYRRFVIDLARQETEKVAAWARRQSNPAKPAN
ncbi:MAG: hypothetical protein ACOH2H_20535 [Cypionkella sp.]